MNFEMRKAAIEDMVDLRMAVTEDESNISPAFYTYLSQLAIEDLCPERGRMLRQGKKAITVERLQELLDMRELVLDMKIIDGPDHVCAGTEVQLIRPAEPEDPIITGVRDALAAGKTVRFLDNGDVDIHLGRPAARNWPAPNFDALKHALSNGARVKRQFVNGKIVSVGLVPCDPSDERALRPVEDGCGDVGDMLEDVARNIGSLVQPEYTVQPFQCSEDGTFTTPDGTPVDLIGIITELAVPDESVCAVDNATEKAAAQQLVWDMLERNPKGYRDHNAVKSITVRTLMPEERAKAIVGEISEQVRAKRTELMEIQARSAADKAIQPLKIWRKPDEPLSDLVKDAKQLLADTGFDSSNIDQVISSAPNTVKPVTTEAEPTEVAKESKDSIAGDVPREPQVSTKWWDQDTEEARAAEALKGRLIKAIRRGGTAFNDLVQEAVIVLSVDEKRARQFVNHVNDVVRRDFIAEDIVDGMRVSMNLKPGAKRANGKNFIAVKGDV